MLPDSALQSMYPVIMTPSHDGKYFHNYVLSLLNFSHMANKAGMPLQVYMTRGESLVTRARNNAVAEFLAHPEWTHLFWIDSDIGFSPQAAFRLLLSDYDIAAGVYPLKSDFWPAEGTPQGMTQEVFESLYTRYTINTHAENDKGEIELNVQPDGFLAVDEAPTGFMVIKRAVFERMMTAYPDLQYTPDSIGVADLGLHYRFFDVMVDPVSRRYLSEDYTFCRLWSQLGEKIYIDANSSLSHQGAKLYNGNLAGTLQNNLSNAVGAANGKPIVLNGAEYLHPNDRGPA